jgi:Domain of unknown function (DUF4252)
MKKIAAIMGLLLATQLTAFAQDWDPGGALKKLSARASKTVEVSLDRSMLQFASGFLDPKDPQEAQAKKIISDMKGIYVHSFEFDKSGLYSEQDVASIRDQLKGPEWSRIVNVKSKNDGQNVEVYFRKNGEKFEGLVVLATEPTELTFVDLVGPITPEDLRALGGQFGIPKVEMGHDSGKKRESQ